MREDGNKTEYLDPQTVIRQLRQLGEAELLRLDRKAGLYASGTGMSRRELVHEAIARAAEGERRCPTNVAIHVFLGNAIRSIAHAERTKRDRETDEAPADDDSGDTPSVIAASVSMGDLTTRYVEATEMFERLDVEFAADSQAQAVILGTAEGFNPAEIKELGEMDDTQYATARRRVRRTFERIFSESEDHDQ